MIFDCRNLLKTVLFVLIMAVALVLVVCKMAGVISPTTSETTGTSNSGVSSGVESGVGDALENGSKSNISQIFTHD